MLLQIGGSGRVGSKGSSEENRGAGDGPSREVQSIILVVTES